MTRHYRNYTLEAVEQDRIAYRRMPVHQGKTYSEVKADRARRWRHIRQGLLILGSLSLLIAMWVLR